MRLAPITMLSGLPLDFSASEPLPPALNPANTNLADFTQVPIGTFIEAAPMDVPIFTANVPNWGMSELIYVRHTGAAITPGNLVHVDKDFTISLVPITANTGRPVFVTLTNFASGATIPQGGWVLRSGICPVVYPTAAVGTLGISGTTPGAAAANSAGRQLLNATVLIAAAGSFTRTATVRSGTSFIAVNSVAGMFVGQAVSGTGIPGGATIAGILPEGGTIRLSANATASGNPTLTFTHTGFGICYVDRPFVQGAIT